MMARRISGSEGCGGGPAGLTIHQFSRHPQSLGSGRAWSISLTALRSPRVNQESLLLASFRGCCSNLVWLLPGSGVLAHLPHQSCNEGAKEGFAAAPGVVHELEEAEVQRQLLL